MAPPLTESCCEEFQAVQCEARYEVGHEFDISVEWVCQRLCRDQLSCSYWTLLGGDCFLYSACGTPEVKTSWEKGLHIFYSSLGVKSKLCLVRFPNPPSWQLGNLTCVVILIFQLNRNVSLSCVVPVQVDQPSLI